MREEMAKILVFDSLLFLPFTPKWLAKRPKCTVCPKNEPFSPSVCTPVFGPHTFASSDNKARHQNTKHT